MTTRSASGPQENDAKREASNTSSTHVTSSSSEATLPTGSPAASSEPPNATATTSGTGDPTGSVERPDGATGTGVIASVRNDSGPVEAACVVADITSSQGNVFGGSTDKDGFTRFALPDDVDQVLLIVRDCSPRSPAFAYTTRRIALTKSTDTAVEFLVADGTDVIGTVVDHNGRALSGATVMSDNAQYLAATTTDPNGHYLLRGLVPGPDAIAVPDLGCSLDVTLVAGQTMTVDIIC
ncbi:MAG: Carboxypeptidase regulatory-like domain [Acidimicrobiaceae bacterium]